MLAAELDSADLAKLVVARNAEAPHPHQLHQRHRAALPAALHPEARARGHSHRRARRNSDRARIASRRPIPSPIRRRTHAWPAKTIATPRFQSRKTPTFWPRPPAWPARTCAPSPISPAPKCAPSSSSGHDVKRNPREYRHALDAKQMVLMFEKASLRTRLSFEAGINTMGGNAIFVDQTNSPLGERESICRRGAQRRALGGCHRAAHLRARHHHRDGRQRARAGDQRAHRLRASLPGAGRLHDARGALRLPRGSQLHLRRRRQQRLPLADAHRRAARRERAPWRRRAATRPTSRS